MAQYTPHSKQAIVHNSKARFVVLVTGRRFGKSKLAGEEVSTMMSPMTNVLMGKTLTWIVAPTYKSTRYVFDAVVDTLIRGWDDKSTGKFNPPVLKPDDILKHSPYDRTIETVWGSKVECLSADSPDSLVGAGVDLLVFDECAKSKAIIWEKYLRPTLSDTNGRALFITTPEGTNWVSQLYNQGLSIDHPEWESFSFVSADNPLLTANDIAEAKQTLTEETFAQEYLGKFVSFQGKVYKLFDITTHVTSELPDKFDDVFIGADYGMTNPTALIVIGVKGGRYYILDEVYRKDMLLDDIKSELWRLKKEWKFSVIYSEIKPEFTKDLTLNGFRVINAKKDVAAGIEKVAQKMKFYKDGKPLLLVNQTCRHTIHELDNYRYHEKKENQNAKEEPVKWDDHACDAIRYAIYTREHPRQGLAMSGRLRGFN